MNIPLHLQVLFALLLQFFAGVVHSMGHNEDIICKVLSFLKEEQIKFSGNDTYGNTTGIFDVHDCDKEKDKIFAKRPFVTITYAQSLDGKIALVTRNGKSSNFVISGKDSLVLTHALRSEHDGILIGSGTMKSDNPRLNNRLWNPHEMKQPRPIVIDSRMSTLRDCDNCRAENLIVCCDIQTAEEVRRGITHTREDWTIVGCRRTQYSDERRGDEYSTLDLNDVLEKLYDLGIKRIMVEGGAAVLSSFIASKLADTFIVTISPKIIGKEGVSTFDSLSYENGRKLSRVKSLMLGCDCILYGTW